MLFGDVPSYGYLLDDQPRQAATGLLRDVFTLCQPPLWLCKTVATSLRQHIALHPNLKESLSTSLIAYLQQHEDLFCQTLHQQLIEFHTSR